MNLFRSIHHRIVQSLIKCGIVKIGHFNSDQLSQYLYGGDLKSYELRGKCEIADCFKERIVKAENHDEIIERIIKAYRLAKTVQLKQAHVYQVSNEWIPIYDSCMNEIIKAFSNYDKVTISKQYVNFMRESLSIGLHGLPVNMKERYMSGNIEEIDAQRYILDSLYRFKIWKESYGNTKEKSSLSMPNYGNAYGYYIDGNFIRTGAEYLNYYAEGISNLISDSNIERKTVMELGAGYGGMAYFLLKNNVNLRYIDIDLPENMALTAYFLMSCFPEKKIMLYGEDELEKNNYQVYDIIILPNFSISQIPDNCADLFFNSYSLAEMSKEAIGEYVSHIKRISSNYIYHVNHTNNSKDLNADQFNFEGEDEFKLIFKAQARWNLMRNFKADEYEYLLKKVC